MKPYPEESTLSANGRAMVAHARNSGLMIERIGPARAWRFSGHGVDLTVSDPRWLQPRDLRPARR